MNQDFINQIAPGATEAYKKTGVFASVTIAQAILESGWGRSGLSVRAKNLFGIKCHGVWKGEVCTMPTAEYVRGKKIMVNADFRKYPDYAGSIMDHAKFLKENPRYRDAFLCKDPFCFSHLIAKAGYATDPHYSALLAAIITQHNLVKYDVL